MDNSGPAGERRHTYRPDIDGLRALAVLLVIASHLKTRLTGGYIGVDIFFVISGYLISAHILEQLRQGSFSLMLFYERRVRRIAPALIVVLLGTTVLAWRYLFASEMVPYARTLVAAVLSLSNMLFWHQTGYFDWDSGFKPLLHTWSLAVEEQFYVFFPLLLMVVMRKRPGWLKVVLISLTAVTFTASVLLVFRYPVATFFFAPLRAWELMIGALLSQRYFPPIRTSPGRNMAACAGLLLIAIPAILYTDATVFPGFAALPPCLGAYLLIAAGETGSSVVGRMLSLRPVVFIGTISYSLYLWHWPLLVFQRLDRILIDAPLTQPSAKLAVFVASLAMGVLSWRFVETPVRRGRLKLARVPLFAATAIAGVLLTALGSGLWISHGAPRRFPPDVAAMAGFLSYDRAAPYREGVCFLQASSMTLDQFNQQVCLHQESGQTHYLLLGDSHAAQLWPGLSQTFPNLNILQASVGSCPPLLAEPADATSLCRAMMRFIYADYLPRHPVDKLLLSARWSETDPDRIGDIVSWAHAHGMEVILFGPTIEYDQPLPRLLAEGMMRDSNLQTAADTHATGDAIRMDRTLAKLAREQWKVRYISWFEDLCSPKGQCPALAGPDIPMLWNQDHLTTAGSVAFARAIKARHQLP